jgi:hypothetical protein
MRQLLSGIRADAVIERIKTNSVLNPLLWLCAITELAAIPTAFFSTDGAQVFFCALAGAPVFAAIIAYFIWMFLNADRLQSEEYHWRNIGFRRVQKRKIHFPPFLKPAITRQNESRVMKHSPPTIHLSRLVMAIPNSANWETTDGRRYVLHYLYR